MDAYILGNTFRREVLVDQFESFIWTERWQSFGDFKLEVLSNPTNRANFTIGSFIAIDQSYRAMMIETVEEDISQDGKKIIRVEGRSLELILQNRVALETLDENSLGAWSLYGQPIDICEEMFSHICRPPAALDSHDAVPFIKSGRVLPLGNIEEAMGQLSHYQRPATLYSAIRSVATPHNIGFRLLRNGDAEELYFDCYFGFNRSSQYQDLVMDNHVSPVVFDEATDVFFVTNKLQSVASHKNTVYIKNGDYHNVVYEGPLHEEGPLDAPIGFGRRVMHMTYNPQDGGSADFPHIRQAKEELYKRQLVSMLDGEVNRKNKYIYDTDYHIGDLVGVLSKDAVLSTKRVTEYIFVSDSMGDREYPTLSEFTPVWWEPSWNPQ